MIEILIAIFILAVVVSLVLTAFDGLFSNADHINNGSDLFEMGSACLDRMAADLVGLHATAYPRYKPPDLMDEDTDIHQVKGETRNIGGQAFGWLRFTSMAHLPIDHDNRQGIAQIVYYVQQTENDDFVLKRADALYPYPEFEESVNDPVVCEHVRNFSLAYYDVNSREFEEWDSQSEDVSYSTPRAISIKLALSDDKETAPYIFTTQINLPVYRSREIKR